MRSPSIAGQKACFRITLNCQHQAADIDYLLDQLTLENVYLPYDKVNPIVLPEPIAPHIAAKEQGKLRSADFLIDKCQTALNDKAVRYLIEGVGGWLTPLNHQETMADFVSLLHVEIILVVGMRLGCLNHALLTYQKIMQDNGL